MGSSVDPGGAVMAIDWYSLHQTIWSMSGTYAFLACVVSFTLCFMHLRHFTEPRFQKPIVRIILMIPIYCIDSWLSISFYELSVFFDVARDCYEAYAIYEFFVLLVQFCDGEDNLIAILEEKPYQSHPWPFCCLPPLPTGRKFYLTCKRCVMQFVLIKPILAITTFSLEILGVYHSGSFDFSAGYLYVTAVDNISITIAVYFLVLFFMPISDELAPFKPVSKFFCIKSVIFFSFWQDVGISFLVWFDVIKDQPGWSVENLSVFIQDALICIEMFILSLYFTYAFSYEEFRDSGLYDRPAISPILRSVADVVSPRDVVNDTVDVFARELSKNEADITTTEKRKIPKPGGSREEGSSLTSPSSRHYGS